jgi:hypothetical protein
MGKIQKYYQGKTITSTRDMAKSSNSETNNFLKPSQIFKDLDV